MLLKSSFVLALVAVVSAVPAREGVEFEKRSGMPQLTLPYGTWQATSYNPLSDIYTFKNIRFGAPPVGNLRWRKPATPAYNATLQDGSYGPYCVQGAPKGLNLLGSGDQSPIGAAINQFLGGIPLPIFSGGDEDCLFLDVYVPGKAIRNRSLGLPVIVWIYGGAYIFGSKDSFEPLLPFYDGSGLIYESGGNAIFVTMNYRMGAFGFLSGTTMEHQGLPNAGLWDQRAAFQWVQSYISLLGGNPSKVTAMGESAGAGSIVHHLVAEGGTLNPLFTKAILQSPAYDTRWDRKGLDEAVFQQYAAFAGCQGGSMTCLRSASSATLVAANKALNAATPDGIFAVGPAADGSFIRQVADLELASGHFYHMDSLLLSHVSDESVLFVDGHIQTDAQFTQYIDTIFPNYTQAAGLTAAMEKFYPPVSSNSKYATETDRVLAFVREATFTCHVRHINEAYGDSNVYNLQYSVSPGWHGTDLITTFFSAALSPDSLLENIFFTLVPLFKGISRAYQSYLTSYVITGDPNSQRVTFNIPSTIPWGHPDSSGEQITGVLNVGDFGFSTISDTQNQKTPCDFWRQVVAAGTNLGGYAPPGSVVPQNLVTVSNDPSANYAS